MGWQHQLPRHLRLGALIFDYPWEAVRWRKKYLHEADVARVYAGELPPLEGKVGDVDGKVGNLV